MSNPAQVFENDVCFVSRKLALGLFFLKPTVATRRLVAFLALYWAQRYGIELLALNLLSNHFHLVARDPEGRMPDFLCMLDHWVARIMNHRLARTGLHFFAPGPPRPVRLLDEDAIFRKLTYTVANAVHHRICDHSYDWPGLIFGPEQVGQTVNAPRPPELRGSKIFPSNIRYTVPQALSRPHVARFRLERQRFERRAAQSKPAIGVARAMQIPITHAIRPKPGRKPFFATRDADLMAAARASRRTFLANYERCLDEFRNGNHEVEWPPGTFKMRRRYDLPTRSPP